VISVHWPKAALLIMLAWLGGRSDLPAQSMSTRFGFGAGAVVNPSNPEISSDDLGIDLRARISQPLTEGLSFALGVDPFCSAESTTRMSFSIHRSR